MVPIPTNQNVFHFSMIRVNKHDKVAYFQYLSFLILEMNIALEEEFLVRFLNLAKSFNKLVASQNQVLNIPSEQ